MSSYDTPEALRANYEALRIQEGWTWAQLHAEIAKLVPEDDRALFAWSAAKARGEAADAEAGADTAAPRGRRSGKSGAATAAADDESAASDGDDQIEA